MKVVEFEDADVPMVTKEPELPHITLGVAIFADGPHAMTAFFVTSSFVHQVYTTTCAGN